MKNAQNKYQPSDHHSTVSNGHGNSFFHCLVQLCLGWILFASDFLLVAPPSLSSNSLTHTEGEREVICSLRLDSDLRLAVDLLKDGGNWENASRDWDMSMHHAPPRHRRSVLLPSRSGSPGFHQGTVISIAALLLYLFTFA